MAISAQPIRALGVSILPIWAIQNARHVCVSKIKRRWAHNEALAPGDQKEAGGRAAGAVGFVRANAVLALRVAGHALPEGGVCVKSGGIAI